MVGDAARASLASLRNAEVTAARGVAGTADVQEVVQAAANAELTVQTMTQIRDKVVSAYMDVLRMAV
jgi:flagellar hook-basal body complex protein FliE